MLRRPLDLRRNSRVSISLVPLDPELAPLMCILGGFHCPVATNRARDR
jgi:hypothetical protein